MLVKGLSMDDLDARVEAWDEAYPESVPYSTIEQAPDETGEWTAWVTLQTRDRAKDRAAALSLVEWLGREHAVPEWYVWPGEYPDVDGLGEGY